MCIQITDGGDHRIIGNLFFVYLQISDYFVGFLKWT